MTFTAPADLVTDRPEGSGPEAPILRTLLLARPATARLTIATLFGIGAASAAVGLAATSAWLITRASERPSIAVLALAITAVRFFGISRGLFRYLERLVGHDAAFRVLADVRIAVYRRLERLAPAGLPAFRSGDLLARLVDDVDTMQDLLLRVIPPYVVAILVGSATVGLIGWVFPAAGFVLLIALLLAGIVVPSLSLALSRRSQAREAVARGELATATVDLLQGAPDLIAFGAAETQIDRMATADAELTRAAAAAARTAGIGSALTALLSGLAVWGALLVGIPAVADGQITGVALAVAVLTPLAAFEVVVGLPFAAQALERVRQSAARVFAVLDAPDPVVEPTDPLPLPAPPYPIRLRGVSARHLPGGPLALDSVDLDIRPGGRVAVVGASGAGKSTLAAILLRFVDSESGIVTLSGVPLPDIDGDEVRRVIGVAAQDAHVFDTTLRENLRLARPGATEHEQRAALAAARLHDWVDGLSDGLDTEVGEHGKRLSGGQRQRLGVARALLADFPVLVLDEPAEHLDTTAADALTADLLAATAGRSTLIIAHRLEALRTVDEILVLDRGRVVERGTHAELVAAEGAYSRLWEREQALRPT
jgi:thiol reductant ABC exporter CydC subunit